jgi:diacylglycerol kinase (ATP)
MRKSFSLRGRLRSIGFAARGMRFILGSQHNAWVHVVFTVAAVVAGFGFGLGRMEWCAIVIAMMAVWTSEALNTALEFLCDVASPEFHPLVEKAKDVAAAGVLISAMGAVVIGLLVFGPHLLAIRF